MFPRISSKKSLGTPFPIAGGNGVLQIHFANDEQRPEGVSPSGLRLSGPAPGWDGTKSLAALMSAASPVNPHFTPMREGRRTLPPMSIQAMRSQANFLLEAATLPRRFV